MKVVVEVVEELVHVLKPFHQAQELLEGQNYVSVSLIPFIINRLRDRLGAYAQDEGVPVLQHLAKMMLADFNRRWGTGLGATVFTDIEGVYPHNRKRGIAKNVFLGNALDPRTKSLLRIPAESQELVWGLVRDRVMQLPVAMLATALQPPPLPAVPALPAVAHHPFLNEWAPVPVVAPPPVPLTLNEIVTDEIARYRADPGQELYSLANGEFRDPLAWWRANQNRFPRLAILARRTLCIPATSAPFERVFSQAGLTIAKARAGLLPDNAAALIYLHGNWGKTTPLYGEQILEN